MGGDRALPFLKYPGGKRWLAKRIIERLPEHDCYVEPFGGMGAVLLAKPKSKVEVWNDIDGGLANVMRCVKYHADALADEMQWMLIHRSEREHWLKHPGETDIQRAARWIMVRHSGYQGGARSGFYVGKTGTIKPRDVLIAQMRAVSQRLAGVVIESRPWQRVFDLYDAPGTVFFATRRMPTATRRCTTTPSPRLTTGHCASVSARFKAAGFSPMATIRSFASFTRTAASRKCAGCVRSNRARGVITWS